MATACSATSIAIGAPDSISPTMRQTHVAGERLFVDFAGQTVPITDPLTGAVRQAQIFVAALGASNYTYAEARWSQGLADWIGCHVNTLTFFGGVTRQIVCDNLRAGVTFNGSVKQSTFPDG
jgi:transposase